MESPEVKIQEINLNKYKMIDFIGSTCKGYLLIGERDGKL